MRRCLAICLLAGLAIMAGCGGDDAPQLPGAAAVANYNTPEATVQSLVNALKARDAQAAANCWVIAEQAGRLETYQSSFSIPDTNTDPNLKLARVENKLGYTIGTYGAPGTAEMYVALVNENGQWKCSKKQWEEYWAVLRRSKTR
jgi:hypothetical protein